MRFGELKTATLNLRVSPSFKTTLRALAGTEHRSMVNMLEVLLAGYCQRQEIESLDSNEAQHKPTTSTRAGRRNAT